MVQDPGRLGHFHHERGAATGQIIRRADPREDAVDRADHGAPRRHPGTHARQQHDQCGLAHERRLTAHVRAGDQQEFARLGQLAIVGDEFGRIGGQLALDHRVAALHDVDHVLAHALGLDPV
ncbi:hypothetical protein D3C86_1794760 [compost metagenome]